MSNEIVYADGPLRGQRCRDYGREKVWIVWDWDGGGERVSLRFDVKDGLAYVSGEGESAERVAA